MGRSCLALVEFLGSLLRIDDGQAFKQGEVAKPLVGANELVDGSWLLNRVSDGELKGVERAGLSCLAVLCNEVAGRIEVRIQNSNRSERAIPHIGV